MSDRPFPIGARVDRKTGEVEIEYKQGSDDEFKAILTPLLTAAGIAMRYMETQGKKDD